MLCRSLTQDEPWRHCNIKWRHDPTIPVCIPDDNDCKAEERHKAWQQPSLLSRV